MAWEKYRIYLLKYLSLFTVFSTHLSLILREEKWIRTIVKTARN